MVLTPPAQAALSETNFGFQATAYGARALSQDNDINFKRTPFSFISCSRLAGKTSQKTLEQALGFPDTSNPLVNLSASRSTTRSYKDLKNKIAGASQGTTSIGSLAVGGLTGDMPLLSFDALKTTSTAWATTDGKLHARNDVRAADIKLDLAGTLPSTGSPLDDLVKAIDKNTSNALTPVIKVLTDNLPGIPIPGLGKISLLKGFNRHGVTKTTAYASNFLIRIELYGMDGKAETTNDNFELNIGRSWARLTKGVRSGVMGGVGFGGEEVNRNGLGGSGTVAWKQLPCEGTRDRVLTRRVASTTFGSANEATATGMSGSSYGVQGRRGKATAWTRGTVKKFALNGTDLVLEGVVGKATVNQSSSGGITTSFAGSHIDRILVNGKVKARDVTPRNASQVKLGTIPGVSDVRFFVRDKWRRGGNIAAVTLTLTNSMFGDSHTQLGYARTAIKRY
jgi:hypothetical protein